MFLAAVHETALTTNTATRAVSVARPTLPAPVKRMATAVVVGGALRIGVGLAAKYIAAQGAQRANRAVASPRKSRALAAVAEPPMTAISETVVIRRVWLRRG